jgi:hypothetical protein
MTVRTSTGRLVSTCRVGPVRSGRAVCRQRSHSSSRAGCRGSDGGPGLTTFPGRRAWVVTPGLKRAGIVCAARALDGEAVDVGGSAGLRAKRRGVPASGAQIVSVAAVQSGRVPAFLGPALAGRGPAHRCGPFAHVLRGSAAASGDGPEFGERPSCPRRGAGLGRRGLRSRCHAGGPLDCERPGPGRWGRGRPGTA